MRKLFIIAGFLVFGFWEVCGMRDVAQSSICAERTEMRPVVVHGSFAIVPVLDTPMLYLVSSDGAVSFIAPENTKMSVVESQLCRDGFSKIYSSSGLMQMPDKPMKGDKKELVSKDDLLPKEIKSAIDFFSNSDQEIPADEKSLFYLRSLLILVKADESLLNVVVDKLSEYDSYYQDDPYEESSNRLHSLGIYEYQKMFSEDGFRDMQLVLEFSRLARVQNSGCKRDFGIFSHALRVIVETTSETTANATLLKKFKYLNERIVEKRI